MIIIGVECLLLWHRSLQASKRLSVCRSFSVSVLILGQYFRGIPRYIFGRNHTTSGRHHETGRHHIGGPGYDMGSSSLPVPRAGPVFVTSDFLEYRYRLLLVHLLNSYNSNPFFGTFVYPPTLLFVCETCRQKYICF